MRRARALARRATKGRMHRDRRAAHVPISIVDFKDARHDAADDT
jgi:hypothetical protein